MGQIHERMLGKSSVKFEMCIQIKYLVFVSYMFWLLLKLFTQSRVCSQKLRQSRLFEREINTYTLILPSLQRLLSNSSLENYQPISPNLLYTVSDLPQQVIVMQDLKAEGFKMADSTRGLDLKHCLLVMKQMGRYHGASAVLQQKTPENFLYFDEGIYGIFEAVFRIGVSNLAHEVAKWPEYRQRFSEKLLKLADNAYTKFLESLSRCEGEFNVLCHGDLRLNNIMCRYSQETGEVIDIRWELYTQLLFYRSYRN